MGKHSKTSSSTKCRLGKNVVLWLMECLTPTVSFDIFMNNYFTSFRLFTHLGVDNIRATCVLNKNRLRKCTIIGDKHLQEKGTWPLWTAHIKQKSSGTLTVVGWIDNSAINIASSESCERKRFVRYWNKVEKNIFKKNNQISSAATTRTWVLSTEWTKTWPSIDVQMKKWWWFPFVWMTDFMLLRVRGVLYHINKDKGDESLPLLVFPRHDVNVTFPKYSKERRLSSSHLGIRNIPSDVCYDGTKHYQVQSEHRRIQNHFKHLRGSVSAWTANSFKSLLDQQKHSVLDVWKGFEYVSAEGSCKMYKKNSRRRYVKCNSAWYAFGYISTILAKVWQRNVRLEYLWISSV